MLIFLATSMLRSWSQLLRLVRETGQVVPVVLLVNGIFWLAYRIRRPLNSGRGVGVVVANSVDGVNFKPVCEVSREAFGAASLNVQ